MKKSENINVKTFTFYLQQIPVLSGVPQGTVLACPCYFSYMLISSRTIFFWDSSVCWPLHPLPAHHDTRWLYITPVSSRILPDFTTGLSPGRWSSIQRSATFWASHVNCMQIGQLTYTLGTKKLSVVEYVLPLPWYNSIKWLAMASPYQHHFQ